MARLTIFFIFLFVLFLQIAEQHAARIHQKFSDEIDESPRSKSVYQSWYNQMNDIQNGEQQQQDDFEHIWKRFSADAAKLRQRRRFGNTRYGRSLTNDLE